MRSIFRFRVIPLFSFLSHRQKRRAPLNLMYASTQTRVEFSRRMERIAAEDERFMSLANKSTLILVVEDVEETRDGIEKLLERDGHRVDSAREEEDAVVTAARKPPDLI